LIQPATTSAEAYDEMGTIEQTLRAGGAERGSFAEQHGGDAMDFAAIVVPDVGELSQTDQPIGASTSARLRATFLAAVKRDALHRYSTRGAMMRHATQSEVLSAYELGRALELTE
jgi:hypothetical protein